MIYIINKKFISFLVCSFLFSMIFLLFIHPISIATSVNSPVEEDLFFPAVNVHVNDNDKLVALTFDDGPNKEYTAKILDYLESKDVVATFFVLGLHLKGNEDILVKMVKIGCEIGNHSYNHKQFIHMKSSEIKKQIDYVDNYVKKVTGFNIRSIRTPYGEVNDKIIETVNRPIILWNVDSEDWILKDGRKIADHIISSVDNGSIILIHDIFDFSYDATILVVEELLAQGYKFVTVSQLLGLNDVSSNGLIYRSKDYIIPR
jgi:peptidoglycan/xylan/chitin deacetylase (PgdA/CDA1 family)